MDCKGDFLGPSEFPFGTRYISLKDSFVIISSFKLTLSGKLKTHWELEEGRCCNIDGERRSSGNWF